MVDSFTAAVPKQRKKPNTFTSSLSSPEKNTHYTSLSLQTEDRLSSSSSENCYVGSNTVEECIDIERTESKLSATTNLAKCICGAGSFALPHVFLEEGVIGGTLSLLACGFLATYTMQSLSRSNMAVGSKSYVELAENTLGTKAGKLVFTLTLCASLGVCSSYLVFMASTLESLSFDTESTNIIRQILPDVSTIQWEVGLSFILFPLCLLRSYKVFAFTSALGVAAVLGGILVTLASGILVDPGGGISTAISNVAEQNMFATSAAAFGRSFGTVAFLFCINFLTFPIMNSMKYPTEYSESIQNAVLLTASFNIIFAALCVGFYGENTADLVLANLGNGPFLSALKILLIVDLLFTFPIVFSSGRQIAENALIPEQDIMNTDLTLSVKRAGVAAGGIMICVSLAQIGNFGTITNFVGAVAQGTLAFIMPPLITVVLARRGDETLDAGGELGQLAIGVFGVFVVLLTCYCTLEGALGF